jgi:hypothetical protein
MAYEHTEKGLVMTFKAEVAFTEAFVVCVLGTNADEVKKPGAVTDTPLGVVKDSATAGQSIPVQMDGVTKIVANGAFSKGDQLGIAATTGRVDTVTGLDSSFDALVATAQKPFGIALEAATASGQIVSMLIRPFFYPWG